MKKSNIKKIESLEKKLKDKCIKNNASGIGGFTVMTDSESGFTIEYRKDMPIEETGGSKEFYDKNCEFFDPKNKNIKWPYTGFTKGNILGWTPISISRIVEFLERYNYSVKAFIKEFWPPKFIYK